MLKIYIRMLFFQSSMMVFLLVKIPQGSGLAALQNLPIPVWRSLARGTGAWVLLPLQNVAGDVPAEFFGALIDV